MKEQEEWVLKVGQECELHNDQDYEIEYGGHLIGKTVIIECLFSAISGSIPMAVVSYYGDCYCFRQSMLRQPKTEAEKERERVIAKLSEFIYGCDTSVTFIEADEIAKKLIDSDLIDKSAFYE